MKKIFTLAALLVLALAVDAQGYRKWDFTSWSAQTVANLAAEAEKGVTGGSWSDTEKANGDNPQVGNCYWSYGDNVIDGELAANGTVIAETAGLIFNTGYTTRRSLAIAVNYPSTSLGEYGGPQYLWLGGGKAKTASARIVCFTIPKVRIGQRISITAESHKPSEARGVALYVGDATNDANQIGEQFNPTTLDTYTWEEGWELPAGYEAEGETVDILVYNTNGCHIYSIEVGSADQKSKVAYLYGGSADADLAYQAVKDYDKFTVEAIEANAAFTVDQLSQYDAIVISSTVDNAEAIASLKTIQPFVPTLNLNPALYAAWGYGSVSEVEQQFALVSNPNHALFKGLELFEDSETEGGMVAPLIEQGTLQSPALAGLFENDAVLATIYGTDNVAIHGHNLDHNGYLYLPFDQTAMANGANIELLTNALQVVANSKAKITQAPAPAITLEYKDMNTNVILKSTVPGAQIFYTTDGSTPTEQSTRYAEPFNIATEGVTVKAVALGDGYLLSDVAEKLVDLRHQAAAPTIEVAAEEGKTTVTLTSAVEGATIYYNYDGNNKTNSSSVYTAPIVLTHSRTIYAFVVADGLVDSELASQNIGVQGEKVRIDVLAHMDANSADYNGGSTSTAYYFSWGKNKSGDNGYKYFNPESRTEETVMDEELGEEVTKVTYTEMNPEEEKDFENGWMIRSRGQIVDWENLNTGTNFGDTGGYNFATVDDQNPDFPATKGAIVLADKNTEPSDGQKFPYSAYIVTTQKYAGPFDVVINVGSITKPDADAQHAIVIQTSTDGNVWESNWLVLGDTIKIEKSARQTHNFTRSYEGTEEVYVRAYLADFNSKVGFYDIYIANAGEKSQERTGIEQVEKTVKTATTGIYGLNGVRYATVRRGFNIVRYSDGTTRKVLVK